MIDNLALAISHGLIALAVWRLMTRADLDSEAQVKTDIRGRPRA